MDAEESVSEEVEQLIEYHCRGCLGSVSLRVPFTPNFCAHCGVKLEFSGITLKHAA